MTKRKQAIILIIVTIFALSLNFLPTGYLIVKPGTAENLRQFIDVKETDYESEGSFYLLTVIQHKANPLWLLYAFINPVIEYTPAIIEQSEYRKILERWMKESQLLAKLIALRSVGYEDLLIIEGSGITVHGFVEGSPNDGELQVDDVIVEIEGEKVFFADQVIALVQERQVGDTVDLTIIRDGKELNMSLPTMENNQYPDKPALGVYISAISDWELSLPFDIDIKTGSISGPSAGMMFVLEIINQLTPEDITGGYNIAGTGTINYFGDIGMIGGVRQKVVAAEKGGADFFIVPEGNYEEAKSIARSIEIVSVNKLEEVIDFLAGITEEPKQ